MNRSFFLCRDYFGLGNAHFERIEHVDTMIASVYRVTLADGVQYVLKICPKVEHYKRELFFLNYFAGLLPVPRLIDAMAPATENQGALLMECLPGAPVSIYEVTQELACEMGALLAKIHAHTTSGYGDLACSTTHSVDPLPSFALKFEKHFAECRSLMSPQQLDIYWAYYQEHRDALNNVDGPCIVHRDFRPGNIIVHNGKLQGIIDWSGSLAGFAQEDFSSMEHGEWSKDAATKEAFLSGYQAVRPVPEYKEIMPLLRIGRALAVVGYFVKRGQEQSANEWYIFNRRFLENFQGWV